MNLLSKELKNLMGIYDPSFHKCIIAITTDNRAFLVKTENNFEEAFDGSDLEDNLTDKRLLPKESGIYKCVIRYHSYRSNIPIDPEEWDCNVTIESCELINIPF
jgi:hypothetical protein